MPMIPPSYPPLAQLTFYGTNGGTADALTVSITEVSGLFDGLRVSLRTPVINTGSTTLNVSGAGAKSVVNLAGAALSGGEIKADGIHIFEYDAGNDRFVLLNPYNVPIAGSGDMSTAVYDPTSVAGDAFDMANMVEAADAKVMTAAERTKIGHLTVTGAVDLDAMKTRVDGLDQAIVLKGDWDASAGTFPGAGAAQAGEGWLVSVAGTVDGELFNVGDRVIAITDNASTNTFAANWFHSEDTSVAEQVDASAAVTDPTDGGLLGVVISGVLKKITWANVKATLKTYFDTLYQAIDTSRWEEVSSSHYTATPASTSQLTMSDTSGLSAGLPVRYTISGTVYYGMITAVTTDTSITIMGAPMGGDVTKLEVGTPEQVVTLILGAESKDQQYAAATGDLGHGHVWRGPAARIVSFACWHRTDDSTAQPKINVKVGGDVVSTNDMNNGVQVAAAETETLNSAVAISTANYAVAYGDTIKDTVTVAGGTGDAEDLTTIIYLVLP